MVSKQRAANRDEPPLPLRERVGVRGRATLPLALS
jgi:hypothetical protein